MVSTVGRTRGSLWWVGCVVVVATIGVQPVCAQERGTPSAAAQGSETAATVSRVRCTDPLARAVLVAGMAKSATLARLLTAIERSDLVVYVETGYLRIPSQLSFVAATPAGRFVRIRLNVPEAEDRLVAWLGHELQHAVEVAGARTVTSPATLAQYYAKYGERAISEGGCTREAQRTGALVLAELRATTSARK